MEVGIRARAKDSKGYVGYAEARFLLRNSPPVLVTPATIWRYAGLDTPVVLDVARSHDGDPDADGEGEEEIGYVWRFLSGPVDLEEIDDVNYDPSLEVDFSSLAANVGGATYRFGVTAFDPWEESAQGVIEVVLAPALWMGGGAHMSLFDPRWTMADSSFQGGASVSFPQLPKIAGGRDGIWVFSVVDGSARYVHGDLTSEAITLPGGYVFEGVLGSDPETGIAWIRGDDGPTDRILVVTTSGASIDATLSQAAAAVAGLARRLDASSPLWIVGGTYATRQVPGSTVDEFVLSGTWVTYSVLR